MILINANGILWFAFLKTVKHIWEDKDADVQENFIKGKQSRQVIDIDTDGKPFTEHIEEDINIDSEEDEKIKTFSTVLHCHSQQPWPEDTFTTLLIFMKIFLEASSYGFKWFRKSLWGWEEVWNLPFLWPDMFPADPHRLPGEALKLTFFIRQISSDSKCFWQSHKNLVSVSALLSGKFLQISGKFLQ